MNIECKSAFEKTMELIEKRKKRLGASIEPLVQDLDSGIFLQYFENWVDYTGSTNNNKSFYKLKKRVINEIEDIEDVEEIYMSFGDTNEIKGHKLLYDKLFIMLDGNVLFKNHDTGEEFELTPFSAKKFNKGQTLDIVGLKDANYFIIIKFKSPLT